MMRRMKLINKNTNKIVRVLMAERKKSVLALCLVSLMIFMWIRVLMGQGPEDVKAANMSQFLNEEKEAESIEVSFIELPEIQGRHDVLVRDMFSWNRWQGFHGSNGRVQSEEKVDVLSEEGKEGVIRRIANRLQLEAIELGKNPRIFLNDEFVTEGETLHIKDGEEMYECEVVSIQENEVLILCDQSQIKLRLREEIEVLK